MKTKGSDIGGAGRVRIIDRFDFVTYCFSLYFSFFFSSFEM